jgi:hypothetical protein
MKPSILLLFVTIIISCNQNPVATQPRKDLIPISANNSWIYNIKEYDTNKVVIFDSNYTMSVLKDTAIHGEQWFVLSFVDLIYMAINRSDGYWVGPYGNSPSYPGMELQYKYPGTAGEQYQVVNGTVYSQTINTVQILSIDTLVSVNAGNFHCCHYQFAAAWGKTDIYVSPGTGIVCMLSTGKLLNGPTFQNSSVELVSYVIN